PAKFLSSWKDKLEEYDTYIMNNFKVAPNDLLYRGCDNPFKLLWLDGTVITKEFFPSIPETHFFFKDFAEIHDGDYHPDEVHDLIGVVHEITYHQRNVNKTPSVKFVLKDAIGKLLDCQLWDNHARTFVSNVDHVVNGSPRVVIIRNAFLQYAFVQLQCQGIGTLLYNPEDYVDSEILSLKQINVLNQETSCVTIATTNKLIVSSTGWTYEGCAWCSKSVSISNGQLKCVNGHVNTVVTPRYKVEIEVVHQDDKSTFVFFDAECSNFLGISALELGNNMNDV
ncbi:replication factor-a protein 1 (Rpa1) family protein, partial [Trifolium medium]|nr:replication factor-a protein 1 (Rpa1) family protein [Trifolium medium]